MIEGRLTFSDHDGWTLVTRRGVPLFGPTWSITLLRRYALREKIAIVHPSAGRREETAPPEEARP